MKNWIGLLLVILTCVTISCSNHNNQDNDLNSIRGKGLWSNNVKGKIDSLVLTSFEPKVLEGKVVLGYRIDNGSFMDEVETYSNTGLLLSHKFIGHENYVREIKYTIVGNKQVSSVMYLDGKLKRKDTLVYNHLGLEFEGSEHGGNSYGQQHFIGIDSLVDSTYYLAKGSINSIGYFDYDQFGNKIKRTDKSSSGKVRVFEFDNNSRGLIANLKHYQVGKSDTSFGKFDYEYDSLGNWINRFIYDKGEVVSILHREIYYRN